VRHGGNRAAFAFEPFARRAVGTQGRRQDLEGDEAIQPEIARLVDLL